jgi:hypothetical protein
MTFSLIAYPISYMYVTISNTISNLITYVIRAYLLLRYMISYHILFFLLVAYTTSYDIIYDIKHNRYDLLTNCIMLYLNFVSSIHHQPIETQFFSAPLSSSYTAPAALLRHFLVRGSGFAAPILSSLML